MKKEINNYSRLNRLEKEFNLCQNDQDLVQIGCSFGLEDNNIYNWRVTMIGPGNTPYEGGLFTLLIKFPVNYPDKGPTFFFKNKVFALFVCENGRICCPSINEWATTGKVRDCPSYNVKKALFDIFCLFYYQMNCIDGHIFYIEKVFHESKEKFNEEAKIWTKKYAYI